MTKQQLKNKGKNGDLSKGGENMKKNNKKKIETLVHVILDRSGSMNSVLDSTINGFNEYLTTLKKSKDSIRFSLTLFDTQGIDTLYSDVSVKNVKPLNKETYVPRAMTPLYDAVVDSVEELYKTVQDKKMAVVVVIMTDGEENSSTKHDEKCLRELIEKLQAKGNWTFTYMGANQDAWANAAKYGIAAGNVMAWASTDVGTMTAFRGLAAATANYSASVSQNPSLSTTQTKDFFKNNTGGDKHDSSA